jgi:PAS domain S-box-containing protein
MAGKRKKPERPEESEILSGTGEQASLSGGSSPDLVQKTSLEIIHELWIHQIGLEIRNEELQLAQTDLEKSLDRYQDLFDYAPVGYFILTGEALISDVNLTGASLLGDVRQKVKHAPFKRYVSPGQHDAWDSFFLRLLGGDEKQVCILRLVKGDGTAIATRIDGIRVAGDKEPVQARLIIQNMSGLDEPDEKKRILSDIADNTPASITIHDFNGTCIYANEETFRLHGSSREEFMATDLSGIDGPGSTKRIEKRIQKILERGEANFEVSHRQKDGSLLALQIHAKIIPWLGKPVILSIATDLTNKKRAEKMRAKYEERYRDLIKNSPDYILVHKNGRILHANPAAAAALKYTPEEMAGSHILDFIAPESQSPALTGMQEKKAEKEMPVCEITIRTSDGERIITKALRTTIQYGGEEASLLVLQDISGRKYAEDTCVTAIQKLRLHNTLISHDILGQMETIRFLHDQVLETRNIARVHEYISRARVAADRMEAIIGFTREYGTDGTVPGGWCRIFPFIESVQTDHVPGNITVQNLIPRDIEVYADPIIRKVFTILVDNSLRRGGNVGTLRFSCDETEDSLVIICEDDRAGIPPGEKNRVYSSRDREHTGIGLSLAKEILSITGLSIRECETEGEGARFEIAVPAGKFRRAVE